VLQSAHSLPLNMVMIVERRINKMTPGLGAAGVSLGWTRFLGGTKQYPLVSPYQTNRSTI
jgi:hypothetical protein